MTQLYDHELDGQQFQLPVPTLRLHQVDAIRQVLAGLRDHKVVFLDAPTGAGKTIIGEAVRLLWGESTQEPLYGEVEVEYWFEEGMAWGLDGEIRRIIRRDPDSCAFCHRPLSDPVSEAVGYGPVCAGYEGLAHSPGVKTTWVKRRRTRMVRQQVGTQEAIRREQRAVYVCTTKTLQDQVEADFPHGAVIKGRDNYPTFDDPDALDLLPPRRISAGDCTLRKVRGYPGCDECPQSNFEGSEDRQAMEDMKVHWHCYHCHPHVACPYKIAKERAAKSSLAIANTAYLITETNMVEESIFSRKFPLIIVDEADTLDSILSNFIELRLPTRIIRKYGLPEQPEFVTKPEAWVEWCDMAIPIMEQEVKDRTPDEEADAHGNPAREAKELREYRDAVSTEAKIRNVRHEMTEHPDEWVLDRDDGLAFRPVWVGNKAQMWLWRHSPRWLLMSATLISPHQMAHDLGLQDHEWTSVRVDSNFDPERRPLIIRPTASVTHKNKDEAYPKIAKGVAQVLDEHIGERILVHTVSYKLTEYIYSDLAHMGHGSRLVTYSSAREREKALETYRQRIDSVLLAPSLDRGIDLPDDLCRVIVIAKVPFPNLGDPVIKKRFYGTAMGKRWFATETVRSLVQMTGRGMRHANDQVTTYILDDQFRLNVWRTPLSRNLIPKWWSAALRWLTPKA